MENRSRKMGVMGEGAKRESKSGRGMVERARVGGGLKKGRGE